MQTAPYGSWSSPISASDLVASAHPVSGGRYVGDQVWWTEQRPAEAGRQSVRRFGADGQPEDVLPPPWNARTRVHEYGGASWTATPDGSLLFTEFTDQRLYRLVPGTGEPEPLTPAGPVPAGLRYAEPQLSADGTEVWCIRESHQPDGSIRRDVCAVPLDGSAADDPSRVRSVVSGSHFLTNARVSPDGSKLAWIAWEHPQMPWDGTELRVAELTPDGTCGPWRTLIGSTTESVLQPEWADNDSLFAISDRSGWWNLYRVPLTGDADPQPLCPCSEDFAGALWQLGMRWYAPLGDGRLLTVRTFGEDRLAVLDPATGELSEIELGGLSTVALNGVGDGRALLTCGGAQAGTGLRALDLATGEITDLRLSNDRLPPAAYLPQARSMTFSGPGGRDVHTFVYPPSNPDFQAPDGELPPYVAFVHGGPTSRVSPLVNLAIAYLTSRGIGVVDVNYGGSTAYGRVYRDRLRGQWGIVDVEDTVAAVRGLVEAGMADGNRLAIEGGSAGGWTVLSALTGTKVFACGVSYFGVADLVKFAQDTHDYESRYLDGLIGPLPEALPLYQSRAPLSKVDQLSCPVLLLQGLDDPVVPPSQSEMFRDALVAKGIPHAYLAYAGESHGFRRAETQINATESALSFYGQVLGFEPPGVPVLKLWRAAEDSLV
ncbi:S9 family peptidase [Jatrophihabitans sp.]|uniref:S9 family peptidase n=1 Tax=Jatrophihabitans sp. TaxID=1932789 RepID=UPI002BDBAD89|nr:prolyl oligopeptidase family serine peptidase [Jatrophihabitans sp.]